MDVRVRDFLKYEASDEQYKKLFYNMSTTMKYIHESDYYIRSFNLSEIEIKNVETLTPIQFNKLEKLEEDNQEEINKNIYILALLMVGVYSNTLDNFNAQFVKDNFNEFELFLPEDDVSYLRGVIQRNSPVYYCDYVVARNQRELEKLEHEVGGMDTTVGGITKSKSTAIGRAMADRETEKLYSGLLSSDKQAAFTSFLILPLTMILLGIIFSIISLIIH